MIIKKFELVIFLKLNIPMNLIMIQIEIFRLWINCREFDFLLFDFNVNRNIFIVFIIIKQDNRFSETQEEMNDWIILNRIIFECPTIFELFSIVNKSLLVYRNTLFISHNSFKLLNVDVRIDFQWNTFSCSWFNCDLYHIFTKT